MYLKILSLACNNIFILCFFVHKRNGLCLQIVPNAKASPYMIYGSMLENKASHRRIEETRGYLQCVMGKG